MNSKIKNVKSFLVIFVMLAVVILIAVNSFSSQKSNDVYADTNIPSGVNFQPPILVNNLTTKERTFKEVTFQATIKDFDRRVFVLDQYFLQNKSPLYGTAKNFVDDCDKYNAPKDCTTVAAIAMNETLLCKYSNSAEMHNCWGFGGPDEYRINFPSFETAIDTVTDSLANKYGPEYMIDPSKMEGTFCGKEDNCVGWGNRIKFFMNQINDLSKNLGMGDLFSLR